MHSVNKMNVLMLGLTRPLSVNVLRKGVQWFPIVFYTTDQMVDNDILKTIEMILRDSRVVDIDIPRVWDPWCKVIQACCMLPTAVSSRSWVGSRMVEMDARRCLNSEEGPQQAACWLTYGRVQPRGSDNTQPPQFCFRANIKEHQKNCDQYWS